MTGRPRDPQWPAAAEALLQASPAPSPTAGWPDPVARESFLAALDSLAPGRMRTRMVPAEHPGLSPVLHLGRLAVVDRVSEPMPDGSHVVLITDGVDARVLLTLRVTPDAAAELVSALMPAATRAPRFIGDALVEAITRPETTTESDR